MKSIVTILALILLSTHAHSSERVMSCYGETTHRSDPQEIELNLWQETKGSDTYNLLDLTLGGSRGNTIVLHYEDTKFESNHTYYNQNEWAKVEPLTNKVKSFELYGYRGKRRRDDLGTINLIHYKSGKIEGYLRLSPHRHSLPRLECLEF